MSMDVGKQQFDASIRSFGQRKGESKEQINSVQATFDSKVWPAINEWPSWGPAKIARATEIALQQFTRLRAGTHTAENTQGWTDAAWADARTRHVSNRNVSAMILAEREWLKKTKPKTYELFVTVPGIGSHPWYCRQVEEAYLAEVNKPNGAGAGNGGAAKIASRALQVLGSNPLSDDESGPYAA